MMSLLPFLVLRQNDSLVIDPLKLVQAREVFSIIGRKDNPVWPGWDARKTPILIYVPGKQDVLVNHPKPPAGFKPYTGPIHTSLGPIWVKYGPTIFDRDGQNTSYDVNGTQTLVVADGPESRAQMTDPYHSMTIFAHEAFHVYQWKMAHNKGGNELALAKYPSLSVTNNVYFALESDYLTAALRAKTKEEARKEGIRWLMARRFRRSQLSPDSTAYEDGTEFNEGLAKYVEYKILECFTGRKPSAEMEKVPGFKGYKDLSEQRDSLIQAMGGFMSGTRIVNNDLYGASSIRFRLYYSGMAIAALLDRLGADWKRPMLTTDVSLTTLATNALKPDQEEANRALAGLQASDRYASLMQEKQKLASDGEKYIQGALDEFANAPGELVIDYSKLAGATVDLVFTPFGILRVDDDRTIFRLIPLHGKIGALQFSEDSARAILQDQKLKLLHLQMTAEPGDVPNRLNDAELKLPGISLLHVTGTVRKEGKKLILVPEG